MTAYCACDCTLWVTVAFIIGALIGSFVICLAEYLEERKRENDLLHP